MADDADTLKEKARCLADWISRSRHFIAFTGAGIRHVGAGGGGAGHEEDSLKRMGPCCGSTSAGIPDYRGPEGTWTMKEEGRRYRSSPVVSPDSAIPTITHRSLARLYHEKKLKYIISQNCDGLHRKSGIPRAGISELHGNSYIEICSVCGKEYMRDFDCMGTFKFLNYDHSTGRYCSVPGCGGALKDTIINFGENLPTECLEKAWQHSGDADLCLVLGSSCTVTSASQMPKRVGKKKGAKLAICNLQETPIDKYAALRICAKTDELMKLVMEHLELAIPPFHLKRRLQISHLTEDSHIRVEVTGIDEDGVPMSYLKGALIKLPWGPRSGKYLAKEPMHLTIPEATISEKVGPQGSFTIGVELVFMGHHGEPPYMLEYVLDPSKPSACEYHLAFDPISGSWSAM